MSSWQQPLTVPGTTARVKSGAVTEPSDTPRRAEMVPAPTRVSTSRAIGETDPPERPSITSTGATATAVTSHAPGGPPDLLRAWRAASRNLGAISIDPSVLGGAPTIRDTRITVAQVLEVLADVGSVEAVLAEFPGLLRPDDIVASLVFAGRVAR